MTPGERARTLETRGSTPGRLDILGDVLDVLEKQASLNDAVLRAFSEATAKIAELWQDNAELRDELHALVLTVAALTRMVDARTDGLA
jgi:hypothetical protein